MTAKIPVIFVTANTTSKDEETRFAMVRWIYIIKPHQRHRLCVPRVRKRHRAIRQKTETTEKVAERTKRSKASQLRNQSII